MSADDTATVRPHNEDVRGELSPPPSDYGSVADSSALPLTISPSLDLASSQVTQISSRAGIALELYAALQDAAAEWKAFEQQAERTPFQRFAWLAHWQAEIGALERTVPAIVLGRDENAEPLFILPLAVARRGVLRCLTWLGAELGDYNAPILAQRFSERVSADRFRLLWQDILKALHGHECWRFDWIDLPKMPAAVGEQRNPFFDLSIKPHPSSAYVVRLGSSWENFYAEKRSAATRKRERRQLRSLAQFGAPQFVEVGPGPEAARTLTALMEQKSRALARMGAADILARPGRRAFLRAVLDEPALRETVHLSRFDIGDKVGAASIGLKDRSCYYLIFSSYADGELARFGPGRAHLNALIAHAIEARCSHFDFTVGDEPYKRDWCDGELELCDHLSARTPVGFVAMLANKGFRNGKRYVKRSPRLWQAFSKLRALAASLRAKRSLSSLPRVSKAFARELRKL